MSSILSSIGVVASGGGRISRKAVSEQDVTTSRVSRHFAVLGSTPMLCAANEEQPVSLKFQAVAEIESNSVDRAYP